MKTLSKKLPGLLLVLFITLIGYFGTGYINEALKLQFESLTLVILLGIFIKNTLGIKDHYQSGIQFSLKKLLKLGIVLMGLKLNLVTLITLGPRFLILVMLFVPFILIVSMILGRMFKLTGHLSALLGVGSCICGASAILAVAPCIQAEERDSIIAVSIVSLLGTIGVLVFSAFGFGFNMDPVLYGTWSGLSLQGVAHAIAAALALGEESGAIGTLIKMTRVLMLVPVSLFLSYQFSSSDGQTERKRAQFPLYILLFALVAVGNSLLPIPGPLVDFGKFISKFSILMAMTALGLCVDLKDLLKRGQKALLFGSLIFVIASIVGYLGSRIILSF